MTSRAGRPSARALAVPDLQGRDLGGAGLPDRLAVPTAAMLVLVLSLALWSLLGFGVAWALGWV